MKLHFLGTGAADWDINNPRRDINFRRFTSILIDNTLLIDPGPCVPEFAATFEYKNMLSGIRYIINTHPHPDHYNQDTVDLLTDLGAEFIPFAAGEEKTVGNYRVKAFGANHGTAITAVHFSIESPNGKKLYYALDSAWLLYPEFDYLRSTHHDMIILDATIGVTKGDYRIFEHNNLRMVEEMKLSLNPYIDRFVISHMARTMHTDHQTLAERMTFSGIETAYDNLVLEI